MKKRVALIFGGKSVEKDISVITAVQAYKHLDDKKYQIEPIFLFEGDFYMDGMKQIEDFAPFQPSKHKKVLLNKGKFYVVKRGRMTPCFKPDVVLNCCHGGEGESGVLQGLFEFNELPHTSPSVLPSAICMDKGVSKKIFDQMLLNVTKHVVLSVKEIERDVDSALLKIEEKLSFPLIIKPARLGSSIGIGVALRKEELLYAIEIASSFDDKIVVEEKLVDFIEVNCAAFYDGTDVVVSETEQPLSFSDFLTFDEKYTLGKMSRGGHFIPAEIGELNDVVKDVTKKVYKELELKGVVRMDYLVDVKRGKVYINEINTIPGSLAYYLFESIGISYGDMLDRIIENTIDEQYVKKAREQDYSTGVLENFKSGGKLGRKTR